MSSSKNILGVKRTRLGLWIWGDDGIGDVSRFLICTTGYSGSIYQDRDHLKDQRGVGSIKRCTIFRTAQLEVPVRQPEGVVELAVMLI